MTMSWVDFEPPLMACVVSDREHSFTTLPTTKECVIAIPSAELAEKVVAIGNCSGRDVASANSHYSASAYATIRKVVAAWWRNRRRAIQQYIDYIVIFVNW